MDDLDKPDTLDDLNKAIATYSEDIAAWAARLSRVAEGIEVATDDIDDEDTGAGVSLGQDFMYIENAREAAYHVEASAKSLQSAIEFHRDNRGFIL